MARAKTLKRKGLEVRPDDARGLSAACSLALRLLNTAGVEDEPWGQVVARLAERDAATLLQFSRVTLSTEQQRLLTVFADELAPVQLKPLVSIAVCPECGLWIYASSRAPGRCRLTTGCAGTLKKSVQATFSKDPVREISASETLPEPGQLRLPHPGDSTTHRDPDRAGGDPAIGSASPDATESLDTADRSMRNHAVEGDPGDASGGSSADVWVLDGVEIKVEDF